MQIKNIECSVHNAYRFYAFTINFGNFSNNDEKEKIIKYFIMTNDKEIYYIFGLNDSEIDRFRIMIIGLNSHTMETKQY